MGKLTTSQNCKVHLDNSILLPVNNFIESKLDIIPEYLVEKIILVIAETPKSINPQNISNKHVIKDLNYLAKQSIDITNLPRKYTGTSIMLMTELHVIIIYVSICVVIIVCIAIKIRHKKVMYNQELPENLLNVSEGNASTEKS